VDRQSRNKLLDNSDIPKLIAQNKNVNIIIHEIYKQHGHNLSYSIINSYIKKTFKKTMVDKEWVNIKDETIPTTPIDTLVTESEESPKETELTLDELAKRILYTSHNLDSMNNKDIINYLQTILKNIYTSLAKTQRLEKRILALEKKEQQYRKI